MWDTRAAAEKWARKIPRLGRWIAILHLPERAVPVPFGESGHWDVEADPAELLANVVEVIEARR